MDNKTARFIVTFDQLSPYQQWYIYARVHLIVTLRRTKRALIAALPLLPRRAMIAFLLIADFLIVLAVQ